MTRQTPHKGELDFTQESAKTRQFLLGIINRNLPVIESEISKAKSKHVIQRWMKAKRDFTKLKQAIETGGLT